MTTSELRQISVAIMNTDGYELPRGRYIDYTSILQILNSHCETASAEFKNNKLIITEK